jgi:hypothetical protein
VGRFFGQIVFGQRLRGSERECRLRFCFQSRSVAQTAVLVDQPLAYSFPVVLPPVRMSPPEETAKF